MKLLWILFLLASILAKAEEGGTVTWWEGEDQRTLWISTRFTAKLQYPKVPNSSPQVTLVPVKDPETKKMLAKKTLPKALRANQLVYQVTATGGTHFVSTGNVIVRFDAAMDEEAVKSWAKTNRTSIVERLTYETNTYICSADAGLKSIDAANLWRTLPGIKGAEPVWWRELTLR